MTACRSASLRRERLGDCSAPAPTAADRRRLGARGHRAAQPEHDGQLARAARRAAGRRSEETPAAVAADPRPGWRRRPATTSRRSAAAAAPAPTMQPTDPHAGPSGAQRTDRTKHDEKITVYISADELLALETRAADPARRSTGWPPTAAGSSARRSPSCSPTSTSAARTRSSSAGCAGTEHGGLPEARRP